MKKFAIFGEDNQDPCPGHAGHLYFFERLDEVVGILHTIYERYNDIDLDEVEEVDDDEETDIKEEIQERNALRMGAKADIEIFCQKLKDESDISNDVLSEITHLVGECSEILYFGKTENLETADNYFAKQIRSEFREVFVEFTHASMCPIPEGERVAFMEFVESYRDN